MRQVAASCIDRRSTLTATDRRQEARTGVTSICQTSGAAAQQPRRTAKCQLPATRSGRSHAGTRGKAVNHRTLLNSAVSNRSSAELMPIRWKYLSNAAVGRTTCGAEQEQEQRWCRGGAREQLRIGALSACCVGWHWARDDEQAATNKQLFSPTMQICTVAVGDDAYCVLTGVVGREECGKDAAPVDGGGEEKKNANYGQQAL